MKKNAFGIRCREHADNFAGPVHLDLTDVVMPGGGGRDLRGRISAWIADAKALLMSGPLAMSSPAEA